MDNPRLLSLDTSSSSSGWAYFLNGKYIESGAIDLKKEKDANARLRNMVLRLRKLITECNPDIVVVETPAVIRNAHAQRVLTMVFGAVYTVCVEMGIEFYDLRPTQWRKLVGKPGKIRKREELKQWSIERVAELFGLEGRDDETDAILIGQAYINYCNEEDG